MEQSIFYKQKGTTPTVFMAVKGNKAITVIHSMSQSAVHCTEITSSVQAAINCMDECSQSDFDKAYTYAHSDILIDVLSVKGQTKNQLIHKLCSD